MKEHLLELKKALSSLGKKTASNEVKYLVSRITKEAVGRWKSGPELGDSLEELITAGHIDAGLVGELRQSGTSYTPEQLVSYHGLELDIATWVVHLLGKEAETATSEQWNSLEELVTAGHINAGLVRELRQSGASYTPEQLVSYHGLELDLAAWVAHLLDKETEAAYSKKESPQPAAKKSPSGISQTSRYRFSAEDDATRSGVKRVQTAIGASPDGWWGSGTDEAWDAKIKEVAPALSEKMAESGLEASPEAIIKAYSVGGEYFPKKLSDPTFNSVGGFPLGAIELSDNFEDLGVAPEPAAKPGDEDTGDTGDTGDTDEKNKAISNAMMTASIAELEKRGLKAKKNKAGELVAETAKEGVHYDIGIHFGAGDHGRALTLVKWRAGDGEYDTMIEVDGQWKIVELTPGLELTRREHRQLRRAMRGRVDRGIPEGEDKKETLRERRQERRRRKREVRRERGKRKGLFGKR